ncbi:uncharacterized protein AMSG_00457 [Thecamonas trahens ATCC 50062]|uniref:PPM-type phosphatase domain-containing protein n=1 Tax=Thecamonas trahens ATCC 50062 TaxID=461836 RepID=A0A0L0D8X8_THETB|nr:hypothetical protein AMSG_00457 [Thecamonas trahens ATCC 50062]KNC48680.1 hypothetical protein AMSG_00457 [Thecamonas trahens ATCC 50062]|eukprot:XP_013762736.1 hypothetical protein AMSG_00457 [Thecamonas trahens ATCC 50062]
MAEVHQGVRTGVAVYAANSPCEDMHLQTAVGGGSVVAVLDGHGGARAVAFARNKLVAALGEALDGVPPTGVGAAMQGALLAVDDALLAEIKAKPYPTTEAEFDDKIGLMEQGACASLVWIPTHGRGEMAVAHLGDTRVVAGSPLGVAHALCEVHNAAEPAERARLQAALPKDKRLFKTYPGAEPGSLKYYVKGIVQVTRALGDGYLKDRELARLHNKAAPQFKVSPLPKEAAPYVSPHAQVASLVIGRGSKDEPAFVVVASDGLWDHMTDGEVTRFVASRLTAAALAGPARSQISDAALNATAQALIDAVLDKVAAGFELTRAELEAKVAGARGDSGRRSYHDDITVIVALLPVPPPAAVPAEASSPMVRQPSRPLMPIAEVGRDFSVVNTTAKMQALSSPPVAPVRSRRKRAPPTSTAPCSVEQSQAAESSPLQTRAQRRLKRQKRLGR